MNTNEPVSDLTADRYVEEMDLNLSSNSATQTFDFPFKSLTKLLYRLFLLVKLDDFEN